MRLVRLRSAWHVERVPIRLAVPLALGLLLVVAPAATAHVVVVPEESDAGGWERYTLIVPTEEKSPTVRIELKLPAGVDVMGIESNGWQAVHEPFPLGAAKLRWSGGRIPPGELLTFDFLVWNPKTPQTLRWDATQWYEDGTSDHWGEAGKPDHPASETVLREPTGARAHHHHHDDGDADAPHAAAGATGAAPSVAASAPPAREPAAATEGTEQHGGERHESGLAIMLALVALAVSGVALVVASRGRGTRDRLR
jgi:uncharacterized protein YcnI